MQWVKLGTEMVMMDKPGFLLEPGWLILNSTNYVTGDTSFKILDPIYEPPDIFHWDSSKNKGSCAPDINKRYLWKSKHVICR